MQAVTSETESKSLDLSICVHHYTLRAPCPKGQGNGGCREKGASGHRNEVGLAVRPATIELLAKSCRQ